MNDQTAAGQAVGQPEADGSTASVARDATIARYLPLVKYVVRQTAMGIPAGVDREDILSFGTVGLIQAVDRFDPSTGVKFQSYAISRIRGSIIDALRSLDRFPRSVRQKAKRIDQAAASLTTQLDREPTDAELAASTEMTREQVATARRDASWTTVSLDWLMDGDGDGGERQRAARLPADPNEEDFTSRIEERETVTALAAAVKLLPERERLVTSLYYHEGRTMKEIGLIMSISESRVSQLHSRALQRLRIGMAGEMADAA